MNIIRTLAILCAASALPLLATEPQADSPAPGKQEWERRFLDRINNQLIWNADRTIAVGVSQVGGGFYHAVYWCFRETPEGTMQPFACYSFQSPGDGTTDLSITPEGLRVVARFGQCSCTHTFPFDAPRATFWFSPQEIRSTTDYSTPPSFEDAPLYQEISELSKG